MCANWWDRYITNPAPRAQNQRTGWCWRWRCGVLRVGRRLKGVGRVSVCGCSGRWWCVGGVLVPVFHYCWIARLAHGSPPYVAVVSSAHYSSRSHVRAPHPHRAFRRLTRPGALTHTHTQINSTAHRAHTMSCAYAIHFVQRVCVLLRARLVNTKCEIILIHRACPNWLARFCGWVKPIRRFKVVIFHTKQNETIKSGTKWWVWWFNNGRNRTDNILSGINCL